MTPAIEVLRKAKISHRIHEYDHVPGGQSYGKEAASQLGLDGKRVFKTLLVALNGEPKRLAVAVVPVAGQLSLKSMAAACGAKKAVMALAADAERATGYLVGGISPLGQKKRLPLVLDSSATSQETIFVSAGRRGLEVELAPQDLLRLSGGGTADITT